MPTTLIRGESEPRAVLPLAPGGDVEPWAVLDDAEDVQMELVINNPSAEPSALDGVRDALRDMHRDGVAGSPTDPDDRSAYLTPRPATPTGQETDSNQLVEAIPIAVAAPSSAEGLLRTAVLAGRQAAAEDDPEVSTPEASSQPHPPSPRTNDATASTKQPAAFTGMRDESTPPELESQESPAPAVDLADDFGPLTTETSPTRLRRAPRRGWLVGGAAVLVTTLLVGLGIATLTDDQGAAQEPPASAANGDSMPQAAAPDVTWRTWRGMKLPVSVRSGPDSWAAGGDRVSGFANSKLGAAIAAANLSVRVDPVAGEAAWRAVLKDHAVGDSSRLEAALEAATAKAADNAGEPGILTGWRLTGDPAAGKVVVHLAVDTDGGSAQDFAIPLAWHHGDWALNIPGPSEPIFAVSDTDGPYAPFQGEQ